MGTTSVARGALLLVPAVLCFLSPVTGWAEPPKLALSQTVTYSLEHNGDLKAFRDEKGIRDAGMVRAGLWLNPTLDAEAATGALTGSRDENRMVIGISQEFFLAGKRNKRLASAVRELEVYAWHLKDRERVLSEEVKAAYYDAILTQKRADLADRAFELNRQLLDVTKERLAAGDIPELEMNLVMVELARSESSRFEVAKTLNQSLAKLWTLMGLPRGESPAVAGTLDTEVVMTKSLLDLQQLARGNRPDLKALEAENRRGEADIVLAQAEGVPNLTVGIFYSHERRADATGLGEETVRDNLLGIRISMPLPLFDRNQAGVQEARARKSGTESRWSATGSTVEREVETAYAGYRNSEKVLNLYKTNILPQLEENLKLTLEAYRLGEVGILAVIQEQKKFFEVSDGYLTALHGRQTALVRLESAVATEFNGGVQ